MVHACTIAIVHACTIAIVHAFSTAIADACTIANSTTSITTCMTFIIGNLLLRTRLLVLLPLLFFHISIYKKWKLGTWMFLRISGAGASAVTHPESLRAPLGGTWMVLNLFWVCLGRRHEGKQQNFGLGMFWKVTFKGCLERNHVQSCIQRSLSEWFENSWSALGARLEASWGVLNMTWGFLCRRQEDKPQDLGVGTRPEVIFGGCIERNHCSGTSGPGGGEEG